MTGRLSPLLIALVALTTATSTAAQNRVRFSGAAEGYLTRLNTDVAGEPVQFSGPSFGGAGSVAWWRLSLNLRYLEGGLSPSGGGDARDLVEGEALLAFRPLSWLRLGFGPHVRAFILNSGTERWLFWEGRVRTETRLGFPTLRTHFEFWQVLGSDVRVPDAFGTGQGLEGGLRWEIGRFPLSVMLSYRLDRSSLASGSREEVLEHVFVSVGIGRGGSE